MTHRQDQRWVATPSEAVTKTILDRKDNTDFLLRLYSKVDYGFEVDDCHIWLGALSSEGYGDIRVGGRTVRAHRAIYLVEYGPPPVDRPFLDHVNCVGRFCVSPRHLEPVDIAENTRRGRGIGGYLQRVTRDNILRERDARRDAGEAGIF